MRREWEHQNPPPRDEVKWNQYAKTVFSRVEKWLDAGEGKCWFRHERYKNELHRSILHFHQQRYEIGCFVIMANHCHLTLRPFESIDLEREIWVDQERSYEIHQQTRKSGRCFVAAGIFRPHHP